MLQGLLSSSGWSRRSSMRVAPTLGLLSLSVQSTSVLSRTWTSAWETLSHLLPTLSLASCFYSGWGLHTIFCRPPSLAPEILVLTLTSLIIFVEHVLWARDPRLSLCMILGCLCVHFHSWCQAYFRNLAKIGWRRGFMNDRMSAGKRTPASKEAAGLC